MIDNEKVQKALNLSYFYLKFRPRTKNELVRYLEKKKKRHKLTQEVVRKTLGQLEEEGLLNDHEFVVWYVQVRSRTKPKGIFALRQELARLGVKRDIVDKYFTQTQLDEDDLALRALLKVKAKWSKLDKRERFAKEVAYLSRRGFSYAVSKSAIAKINKTRYNMGS